MALTDIERNRAKPLETNTVDALVRDYKALGAQYPLFAAAPAVRAATESSNGRQVTAVSGARATMASCAASTSPITG